ncbi:MAG: hypothetical protein ACK41O_26890 [Runella zeae]
MENSSDDSNKVTMELQLPQRMHNFIIWGWWQEHDYMRKQNITCQIDRVRGTNLTGSHIITKFSLAHKHRAHTHTHTHTHTSLSLYLSIYLSIYPSISLSLYLSISLSLSIYLSIYPSIYLSI